MVCISMAIPAIYANINKLLLVIQRIYLFFICRVSILPINTTYTIIWLIMLLIIKMSGHFNIDPFTAFILNWLDGIITGEEHNNNWTGSPVLEEKKEEEEDNMVEFDNFSEYGITSDTLTEIVMSDDEFRDGITSIVRETRETCGNEGWDDVYDKACERCRADVKEKYDNTCNSIREELGGYRRVSRVVKGRKGTIWGKT